jgi:capsular exopolysaccharide synthesis family protein
MDPALLARPIGSTVLEPKTVARELPVSYVQILARRKWFILLCFIGGMLLAGGLMSRQKPIYQARAALEVQGLNGNVLGSREVDPSATVDNSSQSYINTQARIMESAPVLRRAIRSVYGAQAEQTQSSSVPSPAQVQANLRIRSNELNRVLEVSYDSTDPKIAAAMANAIVNASVAEDMDSRWRSTKQTGEWLAQELQDLRTKVRQSEAALQAYTAKSGLLFTSDDASVTEAQLSQLQEELARARGDRVVKQSLNEQTQAQAQKAATSGVPVQDSLLQEYQARLTDLNRQLADLTAIYGPGYRKVRQLKSQISEVEQSMRRQEEAVKHRLDTDLAAAQRREALLSSAYAKQVKAVTDQQAKTVNYHILKREAETNRQIYDAVLQKVKSYNIASAMRTSNLRVIDPADTPIYPYKPNIGLAATMGGVTGLFGGLLWVLLKGQSDKSIRQPGQMAHYLQLSELGVIPSAEVDGYGSLAAGAKKYLDKFRAFQNGSSNGAAGSPPAPKYHSELGIVTYQNGSSILAESFRSTYASLLLSNADAHNSQVLVISSLNPAEGKTTVASNIGIVRSEHQGKVLLIDADRKRPRLHTVFECEDTVGLGDVLSSNRPLDHYAIGELVSATKYPNLYVLPRGRTAPEIPSRLYSERMERLLDRLRKEFDTIIIDTPPLIHLSDARLLGRLSDGLILVFRAGQSRWDEALIVQQRLAEDGVPVLGSILNDWNPKGSGSTYMSKAQRYTYSTSA